MESNQPIPLVTFALLNTRVRDVVQRRIDNGEYTERGFARLIGISQPQMHNILKGQRKLSPEVADTILSKLQISLAALLLPAEVAAGCLKRPPASAASNHAPMPNASGF